MEREQQQHRVEEGELFPTSSVSEADGAANDRPTGGRPETQGQLTQVLHRSRRRGQPLLGGGVDRLVARVHSGRPAATMGRLQPWTMLLALAAMGLASLTSAGGLRPPNQQRPSFDLHCPLPTPAHPVRAGVRVFTGSSVQHASAPGSEPHDRGRSALAAETNNSHTTDTRCTVGEQ